MTSIKALTSVFLVGLMATAYPSSDAQAKCKKGDFVCEAKEEAEKKAQAAREAAQRAAEAAARSKAAEEARKAAEAAARSKAAEEARKAAEAAAKSKAAEEARKAAKFVAKKFDASDLIDINTKQSVSEFDINGAIKKINGRIMWNHTAKPAAGTTGSVELLPIEQPPPGDPKDQTVPAAVAKYENYYIRVGVPGADMTKRTPVVETPKNVDRRNWQSAVQDQGGRGTCTAFAVGAAIEAKLKEKKAGIGHISKEYLYWLAVSKNERRACASDGQSLGVYHNKIIKADVLKVPEQKFWPYQKNTGLFGEDLICPGDAPREAKQKAKVKVNNAYYFQSLRADTARPSPTAKSADNPAYIEAWLAAGYDVVIGVGWAVNHKTAYGLSNIRGIIDVNKVNGKRAKAEGGHAMSIVGYNRNGDKKIGGGYFIVKNSWGTGHGDGGYIKLSYDYIRAYAWSGLVIADVTVLN